MSLKNKKDIQTQLWNARKAKSYAESCIKSNKYHAFYADYEQFIKRMDQRIGRLEKALEELK